MNVLLFTALSPKEAWFALNRSERQRWLDNVIARLAEFRIGVNGDSGVIWSGRHATDAGDRQVYLFWSVTSTDAADGIVEALRRDDVREYFDFKMLGGGGVVESNADAIRPFLDL